MGLSRLGSLWEWDWEFNWDWKAHPKYGWTLLGWGFRLNKKHELSCSLLLDCKCNVASFIPLHHDPPTMMGCIHALGAFYPRTGQIAKVPWASDKANKLQKGSGLEVQQVGCLSCIHSALGSVPHPTWRQGHAGEISALRKRRQEKRKQETEVTGNGNHPSVRVS